MVGFGRFGNVKSGHFRPFFGVGPRTKVAPINVFNLGIFREFYRFGHPRAAGACGGGWDTVAVGHWVPEQSPVCHERVGLLGFEFGCRLSLDRISPIVRFPGFDRSLIGVPDTPKFQTLDLIRRGRSMTTAPSSDPPAQSASAATAPALLDHVVVGPGASQAPASSASSVAQPASARRRHRPTDTIDTTSTDGTGASGSQPAKKNTRGPCRQLKTAKVTRVTNSRISIGYDERHRAAPTAELHSSLAHDIGHVVRTHCPMQWKSWRVMPDEIKAEVRGQLSTNYNLEDLDEESLTYVNRLFAERYKQWKSDLHHHFQAYDDPQVALQEGCPKELEGREDSWEWLCAHFQAPEFVGNRKKKTLLHHSGSRPFSYRMDARRREGSKFPEIDVFGDVYVRPLNELAESLHTMMVERSQLVLQESASQLPPETPIESVAPPQDAGFQILTETLDQTLGRRPGTYCRGMGNARRREPRPRSSAQSNSQVIALTAQVATLENKLSVILQSLAQSGIPVPHFDAPTSEPVHPEHPHQTTAPVNAQTSDPHISDDSVDFDSLFD
ncbi:Ankyrin repeat family protein [Prunus dulcis]|uniref:Ankyrin repeat family protein n=1 Tax=Prunus dulcis TaxID=3755 RepID=A0A4Y1RQ79_PRUDU|nr:Ankyrin repeat family protein [Prunus dulcis]